MTTLKEEFLREFLDLGVVGLSASSLVRREQETLIEKMSTTLSSSPQLMELLNQTRDRLEFNHGHGLRAGVIFMDLITQEPDITADFTYESLCAAGCYHDVGKLSTPESILFKSGDLTAEERVVMNLHEFYGAKTLRAINGRFSQAHSLVGTHHLYPRLVSEGQFTESRDSLTRATMLLSLADYFEALTSRRDYKPPFPTSKVKAELGRTHPHLTKEVAYLVTRYTNAKD